jgi:microcompartment protein CcmL/EutN
VVYEAIGLVEIESIAAGIEAADAMVKAAPVDFVDASMVTPGKYIVVVHGDPTSVAASVAAGREVAGAAVLDTLVIAYVHPQVYAAIRAPRAAAAAGALGFVETATVATGIVAADDAAKAAEVELLHLHLARGIGGKSILTLAGALPDVQAAVEAGSRAARAAGRLVATRVLANPHPDLVRRVQPAAPPAES